MIRAALTARMGLSTAANGNGFAGLTFDTTNMRGAPFTTGTTSTTRKLQCHDCTTPKSINVINNAIFMLQRALHLPAPQ